MDDWQRALTAQVARNIEYYRHALGLSRTALAARCTDLGLPTKRPALAALLDGRRQTVTLQELVVLAAALQTTVAQLVVPVHDGGTAITTPGTEEHAIHAVERLFAVTTDPYTAGPFRHHLRFLRAAQRFERANRRLATLSHDLAVGSRAPVVVDGHPHPATEILAAEAAFSRLNAAHRELLEHDQVPPPLPYRWTVRDQNGAELELPILALLENLDSALLPLYVYRLHENHLPKSRLVIQRDD